MIQYTPYYLLMLWVGILPFSPLLLRYIFIPAQILFLCWAAAISICYFYPAQWVCAACCTANVSLQKPFPGDLIASSLQCTQPPWAEPGIQSLIFESGSSRWQFEHYCNSSRLTKYFLVKWHWNVFKCFTTGLLLKYTIFQLRISGYFLEMMQGARTSASSTAEHSCKIWVWTAQCLQEFCDCDTVWKTKHTSAPTGRV